MFESSFCPAQISFEEFIDCVDLINKYGLYTDLWGFTSLGGECESCTLRDAFGLESDDPLPYGRYLYGFTQEIEVIKGLFFLAKGKGCYLSQVNDVFDEWFFLLRVQ